jgi:hypothetical protein
MMKRGRTQTVFTAMAVTSMALVLSVKVMSAQGARGRGAGAPPTAPAVPAGPARAMAPKDFTGSWVSVVTEHWHLRMTVPPKGEFAMLPLNAEARRIANLWDPGKDKAAGEECKSYGAANIMRVPGRLQIHWAGDNVLQLDTDAGTQTRLFPFGRSAPTDQAPQWQGESVAAWSARGSGGLSGQLVVTTRRMRPGYLRKNGVPYSQDAVLEEYFDTFTEPNGDAWLLVTSIIRDPVYLTQPYTTTTSFKKIPDRSGWDPTPCRSDEPR